MKRSNALGKSRRHRSRNWLEAVYVVSLGCPKNLVDTELITGFLVTNGFALTMVPEDASLYLINTCGFIAPAREEAEEAISEAIEWKKSIGKKGFIVVCGCLVQWDKNKVYAEKFPEIDLWCGIDQIPEIGKYVSELFDKKRSEHKFLCNFNPSFMNDEKMPRLQLTLPHLAFVKISDGCNNHCTYCTIPGIRGALRSRDIASIVCECRNLLENGVRELILIGQDVTAFGSEKDGKSHLIELLKALDKLGGEYWIRLLYTHPAHYTDEFISFLAESEHVIPYLDMPLQHIGDNILKSMNRHIDEESVRNLVFKLRNTIPDLALRTTFITGFPGEREKDFCKLRDFVKEQKFQRLGVFSYYSEAGTKAVDFDNKVSRKIARERCEELMRLQSEISLTNNKNIVGQDLDVIIDQVRGATAIARSYMDAPEIDNNVIIEEAGNLMSGDFCKVKIVNCDQYSLSGMIME